MIMIVGILFILSIVSVIGAAISNDEDIIFLGGLSSGAFIASAIFIFIYNDDIKPIDVYRGKTDLKYKIEVINNDTIVTDSIVVWK